MSLFGFFRKQKKEVSQNKFIGRHQQACFVQRMIGIEATALELRIAANKDLGERNEIVSQLTELERYMESDFFTSQYDIAYTNKSITRIIETGYKTCVLMNDAELENRCLTIYKQVIEYAKKQGQKNEDLSPSQAIQLDGLLDAKTVVGFFSYIDLGGLLETATQEHAWLIVSGLVNSVKKYNMIVQVLGSLSLADVERYAENLRELKSEFVKNGKINERESHEIEQMIEQGITENKEIHQLHPDRA